MIVCKYMVKYAKVQASNWWKLDIFGFQVNISQRAVIIDMSSLTVRLVTLVSQQNENPSTDFALFTNNMTMVISRINNLGVFIYFGGIYLPLWQAIPSWLHHNYGECCSQMGEGLDGVIASLNMTTSTTHLWSDIRYHSGIKLSTLLLRAIVRRQ